MVGEKRLQIQPTDTDRQSRGGISQAMYVERGRDAEPPTNKSQHQCIFFVEELDGIGGNVERTTNHHFARPG